MADRLELSVEAAYDRWAAGYDAYDNPMVFMARHALDQEDFSPVQTAVEFGCGTGRNLALLAQAGVPRVIGLDLSMEMLRQVPAALPGISLLRHDTANPAPLQEGCADLVLFCLTLEHAEDLERPFVEAAKLLSSNGRILLFEIHPFFAFQGGKAHFKADGEEIAMPTFPHLFSDYVMAAREAGLVLDRAKEWCPRHVVEAGMAETDLPAKVVKRGLDMPLGMSMVYRRA